ncbi:MAG: hypothetical protein K6G83_10950, partial [Lachnospiraceae bacterium]|nr:hypothetical protein [Lachnospiraceae bacterium]
MNTKSCPVRALLACLLLVFLSACGKEEEYHETTLRLLKKGQIENEIVENFGQNYYNADELRTMLTESAEDYAKLTGKKDGAVFKSLSVENNVAKAVFRFKSAADYAAFNQTEFFVGTLNEARAQSYDLGVSLISPLDGGISELASLPADTRLIIVKEPVMVVPDGDIAYVSANVEYVDDRHARVSSD